MKHDQGFTRLTRNQSSRSSIKTWFSSLGLSLMCLIKATPVLAHHPIGGETPSNFSEGLLSGLGHPVIGIDHFVFVIALGLLAILGSRWGIMIPLSFVAATILGTVIHLQAVDLPLVEIVITASVLIAGILLAQKEPANMVLPIVLGAIAGIFHGYAYGEAIIGAETTVLGAYLLGFALIQLAISFAAYGLGRGLLPQAQGHNLQHLPLRLAGFVIAGVGLAFLSSTIIG